MLEIKVECKSHACIVQGSGLIRANQLHMLVVVFGVLYAAIMSINDMISAVLITFSLKVAVKLAHLLAIMVAVNALPHVVLWPALYIFIQHIRYIHHTSLGVHLEIKLLYCNLYSGKYTTSSCVGW